jgi:drug/metabolite transporter (DMT)-like permease
MNKNTKGTIFLLLAALVWGCGLVAQKAGMSHLGPFAFTAIRCTLGGVIMLPLISILNKSKSSEPKDKATTKRTLLGAACCSIALTSLILFQQFGLPHTTVGKAGFITALYILITPIMGIFLGKRAPRSLWIGVAVGLVGMYMLCLYNGFSGFTFGDLMMLLASVAAAAHIHVIDHFVETVDPVKLSAYQFIITGLICIIPAIIFETVTWNAIIDCLIPILYAGIFSCAVGYTCQVVGQKYVDPSLSSLLLSLETVFSLFAGWLIFGEVLATNEYIGCGLMFIAILIAQIHKKNRK